MQVLHTIIFLETKLNLEESGYLDLCVCAKSIGICKKTIIEFKEFFLFTVYNTSLFT